MSARARVGLHLALAVALIVTGGADAIGSAVLAGILVVHRLFAGALALALIGVIGALALVAGVRILRGRALLGREPPPWSWAMGLLLAGAVAMLIIGGQFVLGRSHREQPGWTIILDVAWLACLVISSALLRRRFTRTGSRPSPIAWALIIAGSSAAVVLVQLLAAGYPVLPLVGWTVAYATLFGFSVWGVFAWWERHGRLWAKRESFPTRWPYV
jgi:hypothetical protein